MIDDVWYFISNFAVPKNAGDTFGVFVLLNFEYAWFSSWTMFQCFAWSQAGSFSNWLVVSKAGFKL